MRNFVLATKGSGLIHAQLLAGTGFTTHGRIVQVVPEKSRRPGMPRTQVLAKTSVMPSRRAGRVWLHQAIVTEENRVGGEVGECDTHVLRVRNGRSRMECL